MSRRIRVLVADDSTFIRRALKRVLSEAPDIEVIGEARDGMQAVDLARSLRPDVMTLDLEMPRLNGLDVLRIVIGELDTRVIMVSSFTREGAEETFRALEEGAFDFVDKTMVRNRMDFTHLGHDLVEKVRLAGGLQSLPKTKLELPPTTLAVSTLPSEPATITPEPPHLSKGKVRTPTALVVVGASTGGPPAVRQFLAGLKPTLSAGIIVVQHMPPGFSAGFAKRLNQTAPVVVEQVVDGEPLWAGHAYVVPSGCELTLTNRDGEWFPKLTKAAGDSKYRPSLDQVLAAVATSGIRPVAAVVLTGMGADGAVGAAALARAGGEVFVQDAASSVVYGMPKAVRDAVGTVAAEAPPGILAGAVCAWLDRVGRGPCV